MDLYCCKCGEPWDNDELHYQAESINSTYQQVGESFRSNGCTALGGTCSEPSEATDKSFGLTRQDAAGALYDLLGDDMDGAAAMLDDMGF